MVSGCGMEHWIEWNISDVPNNAMIGNTISSPGS